MKTIKNLIYTIRDVLGWDSWVLITKVVNGMAVHGRTFMSQQDAFYFAKLFRLPGICKTKGYSRRIIWL